MTSKICIKCLCERPLDGFYRNKNMTGGRLNTCIECSKRDQLARRASNPEKTVERDRRCARNYRESDAGRAALALRQKEYRENHPRKVSANRKVAQALRTGKLIAQPCWVCGETAEAHHPDYDRPLDVVWLCSRHHKQAHALVREPQQWRRDFGATIVR